MSKFLDFPDTLTEWQGSGQKDAFGNYSAYTATTRKCRIVEEFKRIKDKKDVEVISTHMIRCETEPNINNLIDLSNGTTFNRQNCREIKNKQTIKDLSGSKVWWKIWL